MTKDDQPEKSGMTALPLPAATAAAAAAADRSRSPDIRRLAGEFLRFGVVGTIGFVVDTGVLYAGLALGLGPWLGRALSYLVAATTTYALNRAWTFRGRGDSRRPARQWALFLFVNLGGFAANYGTYGMLIALSPIVAAYPVLGVAAGSVAGLAVNFTLSRRFVFAAPSLVDGAEPQRGEA
jgi:putative flippase GtrA